MCRLPTSGNGSFQSNWYKSRHTASEKTRWDPGTRSGSRAWDREWGIHGATAPISSGSLGSPPREARSATTPLSVIEDAAAFERMTSRREFLEATAASAAGLWLPAEPLAGTPPPRGFLDLRRPPDSVRVQTATDYFTLVGSDGGQWAGNGVAVTDRKSTRLNSSHRT